MAKSEFIKWILMFGLGPPFALVWGVFPILLGIWMLVIGSPVGVIAALIMAVPFYKSRVATVPYYLLRAMWVYERMD